MTQQSGKSAEKTKIGDSEQALSLIVDSGVQRNFARSLLNVYERWVIKIANEILKSLVYFFIFSLLFIISVVDLKNQTISNKLTFTIFVVSLIYKVYEGSLLDSIKGLLTGFVIFYVIAIISKGGMGGGDIKLVASVGTLLGFEATLSMISLSFILGGVVAIILLITKVKTRKDSIPFAPFISISTFVILLGVL